MANGDNESYRPYFVEEQELYESPPEPYRPPPTSLRREDIRRILEETPIGGSFPPEQNPWVTSTNPTGATIGVDRSREIIEVPRSALFPSWGTVRMTRGEAGQRVHDREENFAAAQRNYMNQQAVLGAGQGYQSLGDQDLLGLTTPADLIDLTSFAASIPPYN